MNMRVAVIGIGSNSLRMLIADLNQKNAQLHRVMRDREGLRVFAALDENGNISDSMMADAVRSVGKFAEKAKLQGAQKIYVFATSAVRDAANSDILQDRMHKGTGLSMHICSGELEAKLSYLGVANSKRCGMMDIGGGSTEIVIGEGEKIECIMSLQMGAVRLQRMLPIYNVESAHRVVQLAKEIVAAEQSRIPAFFRPRWIGVGGTFTAAAAMVQNISWMSKESIHGYVLTKEAVVDCMEWLAPMSIDKRKTLNGLHPQRADIVVHGLAILYACMQSIEIENIMVSEFGNLEGYLRYQYFLS